MARRREGLFDKWEWWRLIVVILALLFCAVLFRFMMIPLGVLAFIGFISVARLARPLYIDDVTKGSFLPGTLPYKVTKYFETYRAREIQILNPMTVLGMGPPTEDPDHSLEPGWSPASRLSSFWAMGFAVAISALDTLLHDLIAPIWGYTAPYPVLAVVSAIGWYATFQIFCAVLRFGDKEKVVAPEPAPATMLSSARTTFHLSRIFIRSLMIALAPVAVIFILMMSFNLPTNPCLIAMGVSLVVVFLAVCSNEMKNQYRAEWNDRNAKREKWEADLMFLKNNAPIYVAERDIPSLEEWESSPEAKEEGAFYDPHIHMATFMFAPNANYDDMLRADIPSRVAGALNATSAAISPIGELDRETQQEINGTVGPHGFRIWWADEDINIKRILDPRESEWVREFGIRSVILPTIASIRGLDMCNLKQYTMMTRPSSNVHAIEITIQPPANLTLRNFLRATQSIQDLLRVEWFRPYQDRSGESSNEITLMLGEQPVGKGVKFVNPARMMRRKIRDADWRYYFSQVGIDNTDMTDERSATAIVDELVFTLPPGTDYLQIVNTISTLKTTSQNQFIEATLGDSIEKANSSKEQSSGKIISQAERDRRERNSSAKFTLVVSKDDPLARMFPFGDYADRVLFPRIPGKERLDWHPGVLSNDELALDSYDAEEPHLLIAGSSGSGKPQDVNSWTLTTNGPKRHGDIEVGDTIYDVDWDEWKVTKTFDPFIPRRGYIVQQGHSEKVIFSGDHLFSVDTQFVDDHWRDNAHPEVIENLRNLSYHLDHMSQDTGHDNLASVSKDGKFFPVSDWTNSDDFAAFVEPSISDVLRSVHPTLWGMMLVSSSDKVGALTDVDQESVSDILDRMGYLYEVTPDRINIPSVQALAGIMERDDINDLIDSIAKIFSDDFGSVLFGIVAAGKSHETDDRVLNVNVQAIKKVHRFADIVDEFRLDIVEVVGNIVSLAIGVEGNGDIQVTPFDGFRLYQRGFISGISDDSGKVRADDQSVQRDLVRFGNYSGSVDINERVPRDELISSGFMGSEGYMRGLTRAIGRIGPDYTGYIDISDESDLISLRSVIKESRSVFSATSVEIQEDITEMSFEEFAQRRRDEYSEPFLFNVSSEWATPITALGDYIEHVNQRLKFSSSGDVVISANDLVNMMGGKLSHSLINRVIGEYKLQPVAKWEPPFVDHEGNIVSSGDDHLYRGPLLARAVSNFLLSRTQGLGGDMDRQIWSSDDLHDLDMDFTINGEGIFTAEIPRDDIPQMRCIKVDAPSMTYRAGERGDLVTHNSVVVQSMLTQLIHNNSPSDLRLWLCEPKIGLQRFKEFDVVDRMVDSWGPSEDFFANVADMFEDAVEEMLRRNKMLRSYSGKNTLPEKLQQGRQIAFDEGPLPSGEPHPLDIPFIVIVIEECATVFADAPDKESKEAQSVIMYNAARIAREARSAGIFLVCLTQYPTNASIPSVIRNQMRRIGLACRNGMASRVVIEENGLETLRIKGTGMIKDGRNYRQFRGFYLQTGNVDKGEKNDLISSLKSVPRKDGHVEEEDSTMDLSGRIFVPDPDHNIYNMFHSRMGGRLDRAIDNKRHTKDRKQDWLDSEMSKRGDTSSIV